MLLREFLYIFVIVNLNVLNISCEEGSTLAFAIDNTRSMRDDIYQVKIEAKNITNTVLTEKSSEIKDFVLVTINDPDVVLRTKTNSTRTFLKHLNHVHVHHNYRNRDCQEMSLTGIEKALLASRPGSYLYVFTDGTAKDYKKVDVIKSLSIKKQTQVVFVLTGDCGFLNDRRYTVYYDIAAASSGQVFRVDKVNVQSVLQIIKILLRGKNSVLTTILVPPKDTFTPVKFTIDEKADYALVSVSGRNVSLRISAINHLLEPELENVMWKDDGKVVKLVNPKPGDYSAWVKGNSTVSVVVYARTDFTFEHGFSAFEPKSMNDTSKQPIAGKQQYLSIHVTDPEHSVNIKSVQILDMKEDAIMELPLTKIDDNFYVTDSFVSPTVMFKIEVKGEIKRTLEKIKRLSRTAIIVEILETVPEVSIAEGVQLDTNYGEKVTLTCKVSAHPKPTIEWFTAGGVSMPSKRSDIEKSPYISYLTLENIKKNETFVCKATNKQGSETSKTQVNVRPVFMITSIPTATTTAKFGEDVKIQCNIKSNLPINIKWFRSGRELSNTAVHSISADGSELTLKSMDLKMLGKYICEASLKSEPTEKQTYETEVKISGLVSPEINSWTTVQNGKNFTAICRVNGIPKPTISWQFKPKDSEEFTTIPGSEEELKIPELKLQDFGIYRCIAKNELGQIQRDFDVFVQERPTITNEEDFYLGVEGDLVLQIPCNVTGFPEPAIVWKEALYNSSVLIAIKTIENDSMYVVKGNVLQIKKPVKTHDNIIKKVICEADNKLGTANKTFELEVTEYEDNYYGNTYNIYVKNRKSTTITCSIVNADSHSVRWYRNGQITDQTGSAYVIKEPTVSDDGNYTCRINTDEGSQSENYELDVGFPPEFENESPETIDWQMEEVLDCAEYSKPEAKIEWLHNGKKIERLNNLQQNPVTDWGQYTCTVSNVHESIQRTFTVMSSGCYIRSNMGTQNLPLISDLYNPEWPHSLSNSDMILKQNETVKLSCSTHVKSSNAFQTLPTKAEIIAQCHTEDKFIVDGKIYRYKNLKCEKNVESSVLSTSEECSGPDSELIQVGFGVNGFLEVYKVCFDINKNVALYATAPMILERRVNGVDLSAFKWTPAPGLGDGKPTGGFTCGTSDNCCYAKSQLLNVNDLTFGPAQTASFKENLNSVAVWNPCSGSNRMTWQKLEEQLRSIALYYETWSSWTGASDYVNKNGGLVPRYLWKVMNYDGLFSAMVYVNDDSPVINDIRCTKPCESMYRIDDSDKFMYCCTLEEFSKAFGVPMDRFTSE